MTHIPIFPVPNGYFVWLVYIDPHLVPYSICSNIDFDYGSHCLFNLTLKLNSALWNSIQFQFHYRTSVPTSESCICSYFGFQSRLYSIWIPYSVSNSSFTLTSTLNLL